MADLIHVQFNDNGTWKMYCIWMKRDIESAKAICEELVKTYSEARIMNDNRKTIWRCGR